MNCNKLFNPILNKKKIIFLRIKIVYFKYKSLVVCFIETYPTIHNKKNAFNYKSW